MSTGGHATMQDALACTESQGKAWLARVHTEAETRAAGEHMLRGFSREAWESWPLGVVEALIEWKLIHDDLDRAHMHIWAGGGVEAPDHVRTLLAANERLNRVAEAHHKRVDEHGGTWGDCNECGWSWPCPTYEWARADSERAPLLSPWNPIDDERG